MAIFLPKFEDATFKSEGEHNLFKLLASLDDSFTVIHSCPWLRACVQRIFSKTEHRYVELFRHQQRNLTGETDFVVAHPKFGLLCVEVKTGKYRPQGSRFVHPIDGHIIDPLDQVKNNAFNTLEILKKNDIYCPVGYAVYFGRTELTVEDFHSGYFPAGDKTSGDGIIILPKHEAEISKRFHEIFNFWKNALYPVRSDFAESVNRFISMVWPKKILDNPLAQRIAFDNEVWLKLDHSQHTVVRNCTNKKSFLTAGFAGSGKTLIAYAVALAHAQAGKTVAFLFKNKKVANHIARIMSHEPGAKLVHVATFHSYCERRAGAYAEELEFEEYYRHLEQAENADFDCLIVDEAQGLSEREHRALACHFQNSNKYIFADRHQIFSQIEEGVEYEFLERTYESKAFFLTSVYRNPPSITEEILKILPLQHEVTNVRTDKGPALEQYFVKDVFSRVRHYVSRCILNGAHQDDIVILSQYPIEIKDIGAELTTIASFRGMEAPVVIVLPDIGIDDNTLSCALGRCTTLAIVLWDTSQISTHLPLVKSEYLKRKLEEKRPQLIKADINQACPYFLENIVNKGASPVLYFEIAGCSFSFSLAWRGWLINGATWPNSEAHLWGLLLQKFTGGAIYGLDFESNRLINGLRTKICSTCDTLTPHDPLRGCVPCGFEKPGDELLARIQDLIEQRSTCDTPPLRSLYNVAKKIENTNILFDSRCAIGDSARDIDLFLGSILIQHHAPKTNNVITRKQILELFMESLVPSDFANSLDNIAGRTIGSLCARTLLKKIDVNKYALLKT